MLGKIVSVKNGYVYVNLTINIYSINNLVGKYVVFADKYVGEVSSMSNTVLETKIIGEFNNNCFYAGNFDMPSFSSSCRLITKQELDLIYAINPNDNLICLGKSFAYQEYPICINVNTFFSNHFAILGNSGSGKSYFVAKLLQSIFYNSKKLAFNSNIFLFDAYGEYQQAFDLIHNSNNSLNYRVITTDLKNNQFDKLMIPFWFLSVDDIALLLEVDDSRQLSIIEKALKLVLYFTSTDTDIIAKKNDIIARSLLDVIFSGVDCLELRNKLITIMNKFNTPNINLDINLTKGGWTRSIRQCLYIDKDGSFADIEVVISYLEQFCVNNFELSLPDGSYMYSIKDFYQALEFALISEGVFSSNKVFDYANILKIRLNGLINSDYVHYFECDRFYNRDDYIKYLLYNSVNGKYQIVNFNINYVDDRFAKVIVKIYSKMLFDYITLLPKRGSMPMHIILEEAHRYVQNDRDVNILGYNIFERIAKEGRKYGILIGVISQRPSEISKTLISQCSNFAIFKMFYKDDLDFVGSSVTSVSDDTISKIKSLSPGNCMMFGSAFKIPTMISIDKPNPTPLSDNVDINNLWYVN